MHSCGQRACSANVFFRTKHTQICAHKFSLVESKGLAPKSLSVFLKKDKKKGGKKGTDDFGRDASSTLRRQRPIHDRASRKSRSIRADKSISHAKVARRWFQRVRARLERRDWIARDFGGAVWCRRRFFSHQSNRFQERRASLRAQLLGRRNRRRRNRRRAHRPRESFDLLPQSPDVVVERERGRARDDDGRERERENE